MRLLLDTHVFLWWILEDRRLSQSAESLIRDTGNDLILSAVSGWEIAIKTSLGRLSLPADPSTFIPDQIRLNDLSTMDVRMHHTLAVHNLPPHHADPFDRLLVAQSVTERVPLLTRDAAFAQYDIETIW